MRRVTRDLGHLRRGLIFACGLRDNTDTMDVVSMTTPTVTGAPSNDLTSPIGGGVAFNASNFYAWPTQAQYGIRGQAQTTVAGWVKPQQTSGSTAGYFGFNGTGGGTLIRFKGQSSSNIGFQVSTASGGTNHTTLGAWYFVVGHVVNPTNQIPVVSPNNKYWRIWNPNGNIYVTAGQPMIETWETTPSLSSLATGFTAFAGGATCSVRNMMAWDRLLSPSEMEEIKTWTP